MIARLFAALDIDYPQWLALTKAVLKMDVRSTSIGNAINRQGQRPASIIGLLVFYLMMGGFAAVLVFLIGDVMLGATMIITYLMFMVGTMVLVDQQSVITSPDDYPVLGFRPISSRTYFAVRVTNVLVYTMAITTAFGLIPLGAYTVSRGFRPLMGLAAAAAFYLSTMFATLMLVFVYAWMLRLVGADRLKRALSYVQLITGFMIYGGYFGMSQIIGRQTLARLSLPDTPWVHLYPPTWFAGYLAIAGGTRTAATLVPAALSLVAIVALGLTLGGRLSLEYAAELGALTSATSARRSSATRRRPWWFRGGENRAVALLVRAQFRNDQKFRMGVLGILPLTLLYLFMSLRHGALADPFLFNTEGGQNAIYVTMAIFMFPSMLRLNITRSDAFKASWIYFATPTDRAAIISAMRNVIVAFFLLPYLGVVAVAFGWLSGHPGHAAVHLLFMGLMSQLVLQVNLLAIPELPFSLPSQKATRSGIMIVIMMGAMIVAFATTPLLAWLVYPYPFRIPMALAVLVAFSWAIARMTRFRVERRAAALEFGG